MPEKITDTSLLVCTQGTTVTQLTVSSQNFCLIEGKPLATEKDNQPGVNIQPFGQCRLKPHPGGFSFLCSCSRKLAKYNHQR